MTSHPIRIAFGNRKNCLRTEVGLTIQEARAMRDHLDAELKRIAAMPLSDVAQAALATEGAYRGAN